MKIHYFQRYHSKENVATANTMLLLSRLHSYSTDKFFKLLKSEFMLDRCEPEVIFELQKMGPKSVADAVIKQDSFQIVVETKLNDWFYADQLINHLEVFGDEKNKVLMTIAAEPMEASKLEDFEKKLKAYNETQLYSVLHVNTTFENLAKAVESVIDDRDYDMQEVLNDYLQYCYDDNLIIGHDSWKKMRMQLAGTTLEFNLANNIYYDKAERGFQPHDYMGLYKRKSVRAIGKICARIIVSKTTKGLKYTTELGELTEERKKLIQIAIEDGKNYGYDLLHVPHRYFFVDKFYDTDYKKISSGGAMGTRYFDLSDILKVEKMPSTGEIADLLKNMSWS